MIFRGFFVVHEKFSFFSFLLKFYGVRGSWRLFYDPWRSYNAWKESPAEVLLGSPERVRNKDESWSRQLRQLETHASVTPAGETRAKLPEQGMYLLPSSNGLLLCSILCCHVLSNSREWAHV